MDRVQFMPIGFRCTGCRSRLHVPKRWSGNSLSCPNCGTRVVVPAEARESGGGSAPASFEDVALERKLASLRVPAAGKPGGVFADESFVLPPPEDADPEAAARARSRAGITLSRRAVYAYVALVPVIAVAAFLLGCWWSSAVGR